MTRRILVYERLIWATIVGLLISAVLWLAAVGVILLVATPGAAGRLAGLVIHALLGAAWVVEAARWVGIPAAFAAVILLAAALATRRWSEGSRG